MKVSHLLNYGSSSYLTITPVARHELVPWLQEKITEQKKIDAATSGAERPPQDITLPSTAPQSVRDVQVLLPGDLKKGKAGPKQMFSERGMVRLRGRLNI